MKKFPTLDRLEGLIAAEREAISSIDADTVFSKDPTDLKTLITEAKPAIKDIKRGRSVAAALADRGVELDPTVAAIGFGCTDNCSCTVTKALDDLDFLAEEIGTLKEAFEGH